jgi:chitinase
MTMAELKKRVAAAFAGVVVLSTTAVAVVGSASVASASPTLPAHLITGYWQNFVNGAKALKLSDVPSSYTIVAVAFADATTTPGAVSFTLDSGLSSAVGGYTDAQFKSDIATLHSRGQKVIISVGGQNGTVSITDSTSATNFANSIYSLMQTYAFDGVDIDLENGINATYMTQALQSLSSKAGANLVITMAPQTIDMQSTGSAYFQVALNIKSILTIVNTQFYNSGSMNACNGAVYSQGTEDFLTGLACIQLQGGLRPDQVGLGLPASTSAAGGGYVAPGVVNNALDCLASGTNCGSFRPSTTWPSIRGAMTWSINWDASNGYAWVNTVYGHLGSLPGGTTTTTPVATTTTPAPTTTAPAAGCGTTNVAQGKTATASSTETTSYTANLAVDGNTGTRWSSAFSDPQWLQVDLGSTQSICKVVLNWEAAYGKSFQVQTSNDAATWTTIYSTTTGTGGVQTLAVSGSGRYVRMYGTVRGTTYGYSLWEFGVYTGAGTTTTPAPTTTTAPAPTTTTPAPTTTAPASGSLVNGGFEAGLTPWTCLAGSGVATSPVHTGTHSLLVATTANSTGECDQALTLTPSHAYTLKAWVQGNYAYVGVSGGATASTWTSAAGWTQLSVPFTTDATGKVTVYIHGWYSQGNVYADDVTVS